MGWSIIWAIPGAIKATIDIIKSIRKNNGKVDEKSVDLLINNINNIRKGVLEISVNFEEIDTWKQVHDITNKLRVLCENIYNGCVKTTIIDDFLDEPDPKNIKRTVEKEIKEMQKPSMPLMELAYFNDRYQCPEGLLYTSDEKKQWDKVINDSIEELREYADYSGGTGNLKNFYLCFERFQTFINRINHNADDQLKNLITDYAKSILKLKNQIEQTTPEMQEG